MALNYKMLDSKDHVPKIRLPPSVPAWYTLGFVLIKSWVAIGTFWTLILVGTHQSLAAHEMLLPVGS